MSKLFDALFASKLLPMGIASCIEIRCIAPGWSEVKPSIQTFFANSVEAAKDYVKQAKNKGHAAYNIYFGVLPRQYSSGTKEAVEHGSTVWVDLDLKDTPDAAERLEKALFPPNIIVDSGNGFHAYWLLTGLVKSTEIEKINKQLSQYFKADHCHDCTRVLRVPGTLNIKNRCQPKQTKIIKFNESRVNLSFLANTYPPLAEVAKVAMPPTRTQHMASAFSLEEFENAYGPLWGNYVRYGLDNDHKNLYKGDRSALDFAVMRKMILIGADYADIESIFFAPENRISDKTLTHPHPHKYLEHTYNKILEKVHASS